MQAAAQRSTNLSTELSILSTLVDEQNKQSSQHDILVSVVAGLKTYASADEAILIQYDPESPEWATRKMFGAGQEWGSESAFLIRDSVLCGTLADEILAIDYGAEPHPSLDPVVFDEITGRVRNAILAPLQAGGTNFGALVFLNHEIDFTDEARRRFLQLVVRALSNAIAVAEQNRRLQINNADLEASQWRILNSRNTLRTFFDNIPSSVYIVDDTNTIVAINSRRSERVGRKPQELVGGKCYQMLFGYNTPCANCQAMDAFKGIPAVCTSRESGPNGTIRHWEISTFPIRDDPDAIRKVIVFEEDVTEKWILESNLIQSEKMASIGQLAANVAHEINNPLAAIIANAQLLLHDLSNADEDILDSLKLIETAGDRAAKIVSNLLESARREKHHEFEEISLNDTVQDAISLLRYEINKRSVTARLSLAEGLPNIFANKNQLKGVWINMINNALGAIEAKRGKITISTRYENEKFYVVFADNGKGILPEHQEHIFEPFFTTKEAGKGTGLGLSVSLQVIKEHHGDIQFETTPGKGTKFTVVLPHIDHSAY